MYDGGTEASGGLIFLLLVVGAPLLLIKDCGHAVGLW